MCNETTGKIIVIGSTKTDIKKLEVEDITYFDRKQGYEIINSHYLIKEDGEIVNVLDINKKCGFVSSEENNHIFIRYVGGIKDGECVDTRTKKQQYSLYALLYTLHNMGYDTIVDEKEINGVNTSGFDVNNEVKNVDLLWKMNDKSIDTFRKLSKEIEGYEKIAHDLIESGKFKTKQDIENSKYAKIYRMGIKKFNNILDMHFNNIDEMIEINVEFGELLEQNVLINKSLFDAIQDISKKKNFKPEMFFLTMLQENMCLYFYKKEWYKKVGKKTYTHPICLFNAWSLIKKSFPVSKTTKVIKEFELNSPEKNKHDLKRLLLAYILLYEESKTIHDFNVKTMWEDLYEMMERGDYVCGLNYVRGEHQINFRNVRLHLLKDWTAKFKKIY
jgi:hypothetical protein